MEQSVIDINYGKFVGNQLLILALVTLNLLHKIKMTNCGHEDGLHGPI